MSDYVSEAVIRRLPGYYRHLRELEAEGITQISSKELGERMHQTPSQIRQDINCFGGFGRQGYGYSVSDLKKEIGRVLGLDREHTMIILGAGSIGSAVAQYPTFTREGFRTLALFDVDPHKIGTEVGGVPVRPMSELALFLEEHPVDIAVLAVPRDAAIGAFEELARCGITAVWNFAPVDLRADARDITVVNVHLADSLQTLSYKLAHR